MIASPRVVVPHRPQARELPLGDLPHTARAGGHPGQERVVVNCASYRSCACSDVDFYRIRLFFSVQLIKVLPPVSERLAIRTMARGAALGALSGCGCRVYG